MRSLTAAVVSVLAVLLLSFLVISCSGKTEKEIEYVIGVSNSSMLEQWRLDLNRDLRSEAALYSNISTVFTDAASSAEKQIRDIERLKGFGVDLLIISPCDVEILTPVISRLYQEIPVIILDRVVDGYDYTLFIGPDNEYIGRLGARALSAALDGGPGRVLEICGQQGLLRTEVRSLGLKREIAAKYPDLEIVSSIYVENPSKDAAEDLLLENENLLESVDAIYTHSEGQALGVFRALEKLGYEDIPLVGTDVLTDEGGSGEDEFVHSTVESDSGGRMAIQFALDILNKRSGVPKQIILRSSIEDRMAPVSPPVRIPEFAGRRDEPIRLGYAQVGTESAWRISNTNSIIKSAKQFGIELIYRDADQSQERQIEHLREFIRLGVDAILLSPIVESGYEEVLRDISEAGIPVLLSDRKIDGGQSDLYLTFIGGDFKEEGRRAARWIVSETRGRDAEIMILEGTLGATPTTERQLGFTEIVEAQEGLRIVYSKSGNFTRREGYELVSRYLGDRESADADYIFAHNDDMILGAVDAIRDHGLEPGVDIKLVSIDGTKGALLSLLRGELNYVVECTPLLGDLVMKAVTDLMDGKALPMRIVTDERTFGKNDVSDRLIRSRSY